MKTLFMVSVLCLSFSSYASDCTQKVENAITEQYPYNIETMTMDVKKLGIANVGHRFEDRYTEKVDVYSAGTSDEGGGVLYVVSVNSSTCKIINLNEVDSQDD